MPSISERFWSKVAILPTLDGCWFWTACVHKKTGYGSFFGDKAGQLAHRWAWILTFGPIPKGMLVLHHCDNRSCCRPSHLFLGTHKDNTADMDAKGRRGISHVPRAIGEKNGLAKLTEISVKEIRERYAAGGVTQQELADEYGVFQTKISSVINRKTWKHVA